MLGNGRLEAMCFDGVKRLCHIRGKMRKKVWVNQGDIVLVSLRDFQDEKGDIIVKYTPEEARNLKTYGELPDNVKINEAKCVARSLQASWCSSPLSLLRPGRLCKNPVKNPLRASTTPSGTHKVFVRNSARKTVALTQTCMIALLSVLSTLI